MLLAMTKQIVRLPRRYAPRNDILVRQESFPVIASDRRERGNLTDKIVIASDRRERGNLTIP